MKFGLFYELQHPRPWTEGSESKMFHEALDQIELADRLGIDHVWEVEHHFLEEYSHSSAPEVFLAACSQRTKNIRLGHGIMLMAPKFNHPARAAERLSTLDIVSNGRVEWGTGESATVMELGGFGVATDEKTAMWQEGVEQAANMMAMTPYPGFKGQYFEQPCRNLVPKPVQKPHPPLWVACSRRESIHRAARHGIGALAFAFLDPKEAAVWTQEYYDIIKSDQCVPIGHTVNANIALVTAMSCHEDEQVALDRGLDGFRFFSYSLGHFVVFGEHQPGVSDVWARFERARDKIKDNAGRGGIGTPDQLRQHIRDYEEAGVDQLIFVQTSGKNSHAHICDSLSLFAEKVQPEFKQRERVRAEKKQRELAPFIEAALVRKKRLSPLAPEDVPVFPAGARSEVAKPVVSTEMFSGRGGGITTIAADPEKVG